MKVYRAYGYLIASEIPLALPIATTSVSNSDVRIRVGEVIEADDVLIRTIDNLMKFSISRGGMVTVEILNDTRIKFIASVLRGEIISAYLRWQGYLVIHASAVFIPPKVIAFMGISGSGKSTTALKCLKHVHNCKIITDDILPLKVLHDKVYAVPSFPKVRIWNSVKDEVWGESVSVSNIHETSKKLEIPIGSKFSRKSNTLDSIFLLNGYSENDDVRIEGVSKLDALKFIVSQVWSRGITEDKSDEAQDLKNIARMLNVVDVFKIKRSNKIDRASKMISAIMEIRGLSNKT